MEPFNGGFLTYLLFEAEKLMKIYNSDAPISSWALRFVNDLDNVKIIFTDPK